MRKFRVISEDAQPEKGAMAARAAAARLHHLAEQFPMMQAKCPEWLTQYASLTNKEREIYDLSVKVGCTATEIARKLSMEPDTARKHLTRIYRGFGVKNHQRLIVAYWRARLRAKEALDDAARRGCPDGKGQSNDLQTAG